MSSQHSGRTPHLSCAGCRDRLQDYVDGALARPASLEVYLHLDGCEPCTARLRELEALIERLEALPTRPAPEDFDARILASVPYESYRAMAGLRAPRVPVFLEREALPSWLRRPATRLGGIGVAAVAGGAWLASGVDAFAAVSVVALAPQAVVSAQAAVRAVAAAFQRTQQEV